MILSSAIAAVLSISYILRPALHLRLFQVDPAGLIIGLAAADFGSLARNLSTRGASAVAPAQIRGRSGVKHDFAFALMAGPGKAKVVLDAELSKRDVDEIGVLRFYVKVFDVGPEKAVLCVSPRLAERAAALAREYDIVVLEEESLSKLVSTAERFVERSFRDVPR